MTQMVYKILPKLLLVKDFYVGWCDSVLHILLQSFSRRINVHKNFIHNFHLAVGLIRPKSCHFLGLLHSANI